MTCFKTRASRGNHWKLSQSPRGNMHKLFDCIRTPLERFLAFLTFHQKEIRLHHLHKRTNTWSAPGFLYLGTTVKLWTYWMYFTITFVLFLLLLMKTKLLWWKAFPFILDTMAWPFQIAFWISWTKCFNLE